MAEPARKPLRMLNRLVFSPPLLSSNDQLRRHILWLLLIRIIFFTLLIGVTVLLGSLGTPVILPSDSMIMAFIAILFILSIGSASIAQKPGLNLRRFGLVQILFDTIFAALLVYGTGCSQSIFTPVFILPVIAGGLIMSRKGGLVAAASATILYGSSLVLEYLNILPSYMALAHYLPAHDPLKAANLFAIYGTTFFITGLLSGTLAARLQSTEEALTQTSFEFDRLSRLYKQIFDDISTGIITTDEKERITSCNAAAGRITGYEPEEVTGRPLAEIIPGLQLNNDTTRQVIDLRKKDGTVIRAGYSFSRLNMPCDPASPENSDHCKIITLQDISKIEKMEKRVREAEKMAAIGELSASIAHDFRNPLAAISGSAQLLAMEEENRQGSGKKLSTIIYRESKRMAKTITEFLQFARPAPVHAEWFALDRVIEEAIAGSKQLRNAFENEKITVTMAEKTDAFGDRQQLQTILVHLLENSLIFSHKENKSVQFRAEEREQGAENWLCMEIIDQGQGIEPEIRDRIFQPFFTTREQGTGLGLAIVSQIVDLHGGRVEVESEPGQGCTMKIFLPLPSYDR
jgi:two-component system sensor histidine kinase PilS (NtrC family)